jgi:uncharacterized protein
MTQDRIVPPTDDELAFLDSILLNRVDADSVTEDSDEGILCVSELDGFLTAIVSGPESVVPSRWLPAIWGDFEPTLDSIDEVDRFMNVVIRLMNFNAQVLIEDPENFEPLFLERDWKGSSEWAAHDLPDRDTTEQAQRAIAPSVRAIHAYWLERREPPQRSIPLRRSEPRIGRNEPCPCGSGKKFKHCCLN